MPDTTDKAFFNIENKSLPQIPQGAIHPSVIRIGSGNETFYANRQGFVERSSLSTSTVTGFDNGEQIINQVLIENASGRNIIAVVERSVYVGSVSNDNLLPGGGSIDESDFQIIGNNFTLVKVDGESTQPYEQSNFLYIRNISAGTINLIIQARARYIVGGGAIATT
jgi:hypothetical protein